MPELIRSKAKLPPVKVVKTVGKVRAGMDRLNRKLVPPAIAMLEMATAHWVAAAVYVAAELGVADHLKDGPKSIDDLAHRAKANRDALRRVLRMLASRGVFRETRDGKFAVTPLGEALQSDSPTSIRGMARFQGGEHWNNWGRLLDSVKTGEVAVKVRTGKDAWTFMAEHPDVGAVFNEAMTNISNMELEPILAAYDFSGFQRIVDVAGGHGRLISAILARYPDLKGVLFDQPSVIAGAPRIERCENVGGSFFENVPKAGDVYLLKHIIHDWEEKKALEILKNVHRAMLKSGKLLVIESVVPEGNDPHFSKDLDLEMLVTVGGRERTAQEYREFVRQAGFEVTRILPTITPTSILELKPV